MKTNAFHSMAVLAAAASTGLAASWTNTTLTDGQSVDSVSAIGQSIDVTDPAASASVAATTGEGLFHANYSNASGYGALSLGVPSDSAAPALRAGPNVSFVGRAVPRAGWDYSWIGMATSGDMTVSSGTLRVRDLTLPAAASTLAKSGAGDLAVGTLPASVASVAVSSGMLALGMEVPPAEAPAANPVVWLAADRLRAEDIVTENGTNYLARWYDVRGEERPSLVDGYPDDILCARPMSVTTKTFIDSRANGPFPTVVANGLNGKPVIDFGTPWFFRDGYDWASSDSAYMGLEKASNGTVLNSDFAREGFLVVAQNSKYDVPVVWAPNTQFIHSDYGSVKDNRSGGGAILSLANASAKNTFGLWSIDAVPVSPVDASSFNTSAFKNNSYHLVSFRTSSTGGRSGPTLIASDRFDQNGVGGVRVAEIIYYYRTLTDAERTQTQKYLMDKWGLGAHPADGIDLASAEIADGATLVYAGNGRMALESANVNGFLAAQSGSVTLKKDLLGGAILHLDASVAATLDTFSDGGTTYVKSWRDVRDNGFVAYSVTNTSETAANDEASYQRNIAPYVNVTALPTLHDAVVGSKAMPCVDLGDMYKASAVAPAGTTSATMLFNQTIHFAEGYIVFFDNNTTGSGQRMTIWGLFNNGTGNFNTKLVRGSSTTFFSNSNASLVTGGKVELIAVDGIVGSTSTSPSRNVFHQYTLGLTEAITEIRSFGRDTDNRFGGLKICEAIAFSERLDENRRRQIEQYLMDKWFGAEHPSAASIVPETVNGLGAGAGATIAVDGDLTMASGGTLGFGIDEDGVAGSIAVTGKAAFIGPQTVIVQSDLRRLPEGEYVLVEAATLAEPADFADWTISLPSGWHGVSIVFRDNQLLLRSARTGTVVFFR